MSYTIKKNKLKWIIGQIIIPPPEPTDGWTYPFTALREVYVSNATQLRAALDNAQPGDDIILETGLYMAAGNENESWHGEWTLGMQGQSIRHGTEQNPIRVRSRYRWMARLGRNGTRGAILGTGGASWIIFDGIQIDLADTPNWYTDSACICMGNRNLESYNSMVVNCQVWGRPLLSGETPAGAPNDNNFGIRAENVTDCSIIHNQSGNFHGTYSGGQWHQNFSGIASYHTVNLTVRNNYSFYNGSGIYIKGDNIGAEVFLNKTYGCEKGFKTSYANHNEGVNNNARADAHLTPNLIYKNIFVDGTAIDGRLNSNSLCADIAEVTHYTYFFNNTCVSNGGFAGLQSRNSDSTFCKQFNNIYVGISSSGYQQNHINGTAQSAYDYINRNVYFGQDRHYNNSGTITLAAFRSATGFDIDSVQSDPQLDINYMPSAGFAATLGRDILGKFGAVDAVIPVGAFVTGNEYIGTVYTG